MSPVTAGTPSAPAPLGDAVRIVEVDSILDVSRVQLRGGEQLRLSGIEEPSAPLFPSLSVVAARRRLEAELQGKRFVLRLDAPRPLDRKELRGELWQMEPANGAASINEQILERGDGLLDLTRGAAAGDDRYRAAATKAASGRSRRAEIPLGFQAGVVLPLYSKEKQHDYGPRLREIRDLGASWVSIIIVWMVDKMDGHGIHPKWNQPHWEDNRTAPDDHVIATVRTAKELGLRVLMLPIVLPWKPGPDDWRGNLRPADRDAFFESYSRFVLRYADMAETLGVDAFSIGSELISLESKLAGDITWWRRIARTARARFGGRLTYSANWDHYEEVGVWDELDFVGMTAYYSLTSRPDAPVEDLVAAWKPVQAKLTKFSEEVARPIVFTEVGYASLRGINTDPWNYKMESGLDLECQERCYEAFSRAFADSTVLAGAYFFDWYDEGGPEDESYTPRGKPAEVVLRQYLFGAREFLPPAYDPARSSAPSRK